ncbi:MAG: 3-oxoacyl-[acyl-carrier-protein] reductase [Clostridia bacterium]
MSFTGKNVLVTGASRGIGREIALAYARQGANVAMAATGMSQPYEETIKEMEANGHSYMALTVDVSSFSQTEEMVKKINDRWGTVDILVNNAGVTRDNLLMRMDEESWDKVIDVNLKGVFNCTRNCVRGMVKKGWGRIINISSVSGITGNAGQSNYSASKAGIIGFSKSVAKELAKKSITCNVVAPGFIESDMTRDLNEDIRNRYLQIIPAGRFGTSSDVAGIILFLSGNEASYITGQVIHVDGGMVM